MRLWSDSNEDGYIDSNELLNSSALIKNTDYAFYTRRHGQGAGSGARIMAGAPTVLPLAPPAYTGVPVSNYQA